MKAIMEMNFRVYLDEALDAYIEVREDTDGLGLIELRQMEQGKSYGEIRMTCDQARLLLEALPPLVAHLRAREESGQ